MQVSRQGGCILRIRWAPLSSPKGSRGRKRLCLLLFLHGVAPPWYPGGENLTLEDQANAVMMLIHISRRAVLNLLPRVGIGIGIGIGI